MIICYIKKSVSFIVCCLHTLNKYAVSMLITIIIEEGIFVMCVYITQVHQLLRRKLLEGWGEQS
jgi:hypothetical protein